jgi:ABC-type branched-subunit amino acid transport system permease subunit
MSGEVVLMTLGRRARTVFGPVAGAFVIIAMQNYLNAPGIVGGRVIQGVIFVVCVAVVPPRHRRRDRPSAADQALASPGDALRDRCVLATVAEKL